MMGLTAKQLATLRFVAGFIEAKGRAPKLREVAAGVGMSRSPAFYTLERLAARGAITRTARDIEILHPVSIPRSPDGAPLYFVEVRP